MNRIRTIGPAVVMVALLTSIGEAGETADVEGLWADPVLVSTNQASREASIALSPIDPNLMAICGPSGVPNIPNNQSYFHRSKNGGKTWSFMQVEAAQTDTRRYAFEGGDCDVAFDAAGTMYSADTWLADLSIGHSTDGGDTWTGTALAATSPIVDRPWLVGGPAGTIHVTYQDLQCCTPSAMWYTRSTDYGQTFLPAVPITAAGPDGAYTWEGNFVVSPNGQDLYLVYTRRNTNNLVTGLDQSGPETVWVAASHNAGLTWTSHLVASMPNPASYLYPSIAMDAGGHLHVVFASKTDTDRPVWYAFSKDQAETWSAPLAISRGGSGFSPWVAGGRAGEAAITWYGSPTPMAGLSDPVDWYFYAARVRDAHTGSPLVTSQATTPAPIFTGSSSIPEFEMLRLDQDGRMHLGMAAFRRVGASNRFVFYYQRELLPKVEGTGAAGGATFDLSVERDGDQAGGALSLVDGEVTVTALSVEDVQLEKVANGVACSVTGEARVTAGGVETMEPFTATCLDASSGSDELTVQTSSFTGGGTVTDGALTAG
ncbi:MAG TPA: sialidase family protein [Actinomycetota bacterium]